MLLVAVQGDMLLDAPAAAAWFALEDAIASRYGVDLQLSSPAGAWRSEAMVVDMWFNPAKYGATKGTARPISLGGGGSVHQSGLCIDVNNWARVGSARLEPIAAQFGFARTLKLEPWHFQHNGGSGGGGTPTPAPTPTPIEENNVNGIIYWVARDANGAEASDRTAKLPTVSGHIVEGNAMYFQEAPGSPIVAFTNGKAYNSGPWSLEYAGFSNSRKPWVADFSDARTIVKNTDMVALINLRGLV